MSYRILNNYAGLIRSKYGKPISLDNALLRLIKNNVRKSNVLDFFGAWELSDNEYKEINASLKRMWKKWKTN